MTTTTKTAHRTIPGTAAGFGNLKVVAEWKGGMYIDLHWDSVDGNVFEVINVYDYQAGKVRDVNVSHELTEWLKENRSELPNYYRHTA